MEVLFTLIRQLVRMKFHGWLRIQFRGGRIIKVQEEKDHDPNDFAEPIEVRMKS